MTDPEPRPMPLAFKAVVVVYLIVAAIAALWSLGIPRRHRDRLLTMTPVAAARAGRSSRNEIASTTRGAGAR